MNPERCKHGIIKDYCTICSGGKVASGDFGIKPTRQRSVGIKESRRGDTVLWGQEESVSSLPEDVRIVHMVPQISLRKLSSLARQCPSLERLILPPSHERTISKCHLDSLQAHGIAVSYGYWTYREVITMPPDAQYKEKQTFYRNLTPSALARLNKLRSFGFEEMTLLERYLCVNGGRKISFFKLAKQVGMSDRYLTISLNALLLHLGAPSELAGVSCSVEAKARTIDRTVERLEMGLKDASFRSEIGKYKLLPPNLPPYSWDRFRRLTKMEYETPEKFRELKEANPKQYCSLIYNLGLNGVYKTLEQIGEELGLTKERVRQLRNEALEILGIFAEELETQRSEGER